MLLIVRESLIRNQQVAGLTAVNLLAVPTLLRLLKRILDQRARVENANLH